MGGTIPWRCAAYTANTIWRDSLRTRAGSRGRNDEVAKRTGRARRFRAAGGVVDDGELYRLRTLVHCAARASADAESNRVRRVQTGIPDSGVHDIVAESAGGLHRLLLRAARAG